MNSNDLFRSFFFAVNAAAVLLTIKAEFSIFFDPFIPAGSPVVIYKRNSVSLRNNLTGFFQKFMFLETAIKKSGGKRVETFSFS